MSEFTAWLELQVLLSVLAQPVTLGQDPVTVPLVSPGDQAACGRLFEAVHSPAQNVLLVLKDVKAQGNPGASWEVHVEARGARPDPGDRHLVGVVSLFDGQPGEFRFVLDPVLTVIGKKSLQARFVPVSGVMTGDKPQPAVVSHPVTISGIELAIEAGGQ